MCIAVNLNDSFSKAEQINIYNDGEISVLKKGEENFDKILVGWNDMLSNAREMPAFGVSLNDLTLKELKSGKWLEFVFSVKYESNGMPFEKLLINVKKDYYGFNLIRFNSKCGYDGRCFYYDLDGKNMSCFYDILSNI